MKATSAQLGGSIVTAPAGDGVLVVPYPHVQPALTSTGSGSGEGFSFTVHPKTNFQPVYCAHSNKLPTSVL